MMEETLCQPSTDQAVGTGKEASKVAGLIFLGLYATINDPIILWVMLSILP